MKTTISKTFDFDAAHYLPHVCEGHKCGRMHGHTYRCEIIMSGVVDDHAGWFVDYADVGVAWADIHDRIDHRVLNEVNGLENPTTEVLAAWVLRRLMVSTIGHLVERVRVYESATTWCEVSR